MSEEKKLIASITKDLALVSRTAVALAQKLDNLNKNLNKLFDHLDIDARVKRTQAGKATESQSRISEPKKAEATPEEKKKSQAKQWDSEMSGKGISSVLNRIGKLIDDRADPELIADEMERARDKLMNLSKIHSPVFAEIGRKSREIKNLREIDENTRKELLETLINWRSRL